MTVVVLVGAVVSLLGVTVWLGLLIWAAGTTPCGSLSEAPITN